MTYFLRIKEVENILNISDGSRLIKRIKFKNGLDYPEAVIASSLLAGEFGISNDDMNQLIEKYRKEEIK